MPAGANTITDELEEEGLGWRYFVIGRIDSYEILESNETEYLSCKTIRVRIFIWNVFKNFPNVPIKMTLRFRRTLIIPYEGAKIYGPNLLGNYFLVAGGVI